MRMDVAQDNGIQALARATDIELFVLLREMGVSWLKNRLADFRVMRPDHLLLFESLSVHPRPLLLFRFFVGSDCLGSLTIPTASLGSNFYPISTNIN